MISKRITLLGWLGYKLWLRYTVYTIHRPFRLVACDLNWKNFFCFLFVLCVVRYFQFKYHSDSIQISFARRINDIIYIIRPSDSHTGHLIHIIIYMYVVCNICILAASPGGKLFKFASSTLSHWTNSCILFYDGNWQNRFSLVNSVDFVYRITGKIIIYLSVLRDSIWFRLDSFLAAKHVCKFLPLPFTNSTRRNQKKKNKFFIEITAFKWIQYDRSVSFHINKRNMLCTMYK